MQKTQQVSCKVDLRSVVVAAAIVEMHLRTTKLLFRETLLNSALPRTLHDTRARDEHLRIRCHHRKVARYES